MKSSFALLVLLVGLAGVRGEATPLPHVQKAAIAIKEIPATPPDKIDDRSKIVARLKAKVNNGEPLVVHVMVPLCDNENQGIVPTSPSLGNGLSLKSNLYWATSNGMKKYFIKDAAWTMLESKLDVSKDVLERVIFKREYKNGATVYLVADAYRGDRMKECLADYFDALSGNRKEAWTMESDTLPIYGGADLVAFNGHNGLMDTEASVVRNSDQQQRDAVVIACASSGYFNSYINPANAYPLVTTTNLLYPGAFILEGVIDGWATFETDEQIRLNAGDAYYRVKPKSGVNGARRLFKTGW